MPVLKADKDTCQGYANCVESAPEAFDIDDDGVVVLRKVQVSDEERGELEEAVLSCPTAALSIEDE